MSGLCEVTSVKQLELLDSQITSVSADSYTTRPLQPYT